MKQNKIPFAIVFGLFLIILGNFSCRKDYLPNPLKKHDATPGFVSDNMVLLWNENVAHVIYGTPAPPPIVTRDFAMVQIAVHDALNCIKPKYKTYALTNYNAKNANPDAAVASAAYWTLKSLDAFLVSVSGSGLSLQTAGNDWDGWYASSLSGIADGEAKDAGIALGKKAADAIMEKRSNDNYQEASLTFLPITDPNPPAGNYRATTSTPPYPSNVQGLPKWGTLMLPMGIESNDQFRPGAPPSLTSQAYTNDYNEVKLFGGRGTSPRTADQAEIANFWWETAANIWNRFVRNVAASKKMDAWKTARLLALANVGIFDGFLASFDGLYHYYRWRPESAIRLAADDGNDQTIADENWLPFVTDIKIGPTPQTPTPPIPEYPNGQAVVGAAVVEVLQRFFQTDKTDVDLISWDVLSEGITRHYTSFSQAGKENFDGKIYAGFNFRFSMQAGDDMGKKVGAFIFKHHFKED